MVYSYPDFEIKDEIKEKYSDIIQLIFTSITIETKEQKQYWIDALEEMDEDQLINLKKILWDEVDDVKKIDEEYWPKKLNKEEQEKEDLLKKEQIAKRSEKRKKEEWKTEIEDRSYEDSLLSQLDDL